MCNGHRGRRTTHAATLALVPALALAQPMAMEAAGAFARSGSAGTAPIAAVIDALVPQAHAAAESKDGNTTRWTCPMHPHYIAEDFGACPICGMDLVKLETDGGHRDSISADQRTVVTIAPEVVQNIGVRVAKAELTSFGRVVRSFGIVRENERLQTDVTARVEGWVEKINVTAVGDEVDEGTLLFELYSPQLIVSQNDYLSSRESKRFLRRGLNQLRSFGVQEKALEQIKKLKRPMERVPFYAERKGTIAELELRLGTYVKRGMMLAKIQDYSSVWLIVSVAEKDLGFIDMRTPARVTFPSLPGREVAATVDYVYPTVDPKTRTGQVRLVIDNPDGLFRPGSYADVAFEVGAEQRVAVPSEAILKNGDGRFVVVSLGQGRFQPRAVEMGLTSGRWTEVKRGVTAGDSIVVSGQFLLDSESALRESFRKLEKLQLPLSLLNLDKIQLAMIDHIVDAALYLHEALVDGYDVEPKFLEPAISVRDHMWPKFKDTKLAFVLNDAVAAMRAAQTSKTESEVRAALADLAATLRPWLLSGAPQHYQERKVALFKESKGNRVWLQKTGSPVNPYGDGPGGQVPWPAGAMDAKTTDAPAPATKPGSNGMRGSHGGG